MAAVVGVCTEMDTPRGGSSVLSVVLDVPLVRAAVSDVLDALSSVLVEAAGVLLGVVLIADVSAMVTCRVDVHAEDTHIHIDHNVVVNVDVIVDVLVDVDGDVEELVPAVGQQTSSTIGSSTIPKYTRR